MTFKIFNLSGQQVDISDSIIRGSIRCIRSFSIDFNEPFGTSELTFEMYDSITNNVRFKPVSGQRIRWIADDGTNSILFDGIIINPTSEYVGRDGAAKKLKYKIDAQDASWLLTKKIAAETEHNNVTAGSLIDQLAVYADSRITLASNNDVGYTIGKIKLARKNVKDRIEELAKGSGLYVWIDENWVLHHKQFSTILNSANDEDFDIDDTTLFYKDLSIQEDFDNVCTRVNVIGSKMDSSGQNRKQGKQKRQNQTATKTSNLTKINIIRARLGYPALNGVSNTETLGSEVAGIIEKDLNFQEEYSIENLNFLAQEYLSRFEDPWVKGEVTYTKSGVVVGKSIVINSESRQLEAIVPIVEVSIESNEGGFNQQGNKVYFYKCNFNGNSSFKKLKLKKQVEKSAKAELLIKPNPPTIKSHKSVAKPDFYSSEEVYGKIIIRSEKTH